MNENEKINYIEIPAKDISQTKLFFKSVFDWKFVDFGPEYVAFSDAGINGGFYRSDNVVSTKNGSVLIVFYSKDLHKTQTKITDSGGSIIKPVFSFPGGRRFHFGDPNGNEYAVWTDQKELTE
jgi:predicted enzyme related to lactoylglutathione lyase